LLSQHVFVFLCCQPCGAIDLAELAESWEMMESMALNNFVKATPVSAILFVLSHAPGAPYDNRSAASHAVDRTPDPA
jgi:hypothetical protein